MIEQKVTEIITKPLETLGFELVQVKWLSDGKRFTMQIFVDKKDGERLSVADCETITKSISTLLDVENVFDGRYFLEVSSPGIDRPLVKLKDFVKYTGFVAKFTLKNGVELEGTEFIRRKLKATIVKVSENGNIELETDDKHKLTTNFDNIDTAKLVLTDELIKAKI